MQFRIQATPNPLARKYVLTHDVMASGKVTYREVSECAHVPLASQLLTLSGVTQVHLFENVITVSQDGSWDWAELDELVQDVVLAAMPGHDVRFEPYLQPGPRSYAQPELVQIDAILERTIRPSLQLDGGDLELVGYENHFLTVRYLGACGGCPSSMTGTLNAIRQILVDEYDPQIEVAVV